MTAARHGVAPIAVGKEAFVTIHQKHAEWLESRGLDMELAAMLGLETVNDNGAMWLSWPYRHGGREINHKRRLTSRKAFMMDVGAPLLLWNRDALDDDALANEALIITEGEPDAMAAMMAGKARVVSVPNGAPGEHEDTDAGLASPEGGKRYAYLWRDQEKLDAIRAPVILAVDNDAPGLKLAADLARWFGPERCRFVTYPDGCKDLNDVLVQHDIATVNRVLDGAKPYPVKGLYRLSDFPEPPEYAPILTGISELDEYYKIVPGTLSVWTGYAGQGKTSLMMAVIANVIKCGHHVCMASFETAVKPILVRKMRAALLGTAEFACDYDRWADGLLEQRLTIIAQTVDSEDMEMDLDTLLELAKLTVRRDNTRVLVVDPWNEIEHKRRRDESETDYIGRAIRALKSFARLNDCAVIVVAHPAKPDMTKKLSPPGLYQISGSANWANKADYGITVHASNSDPDNWIIDVMISKVRMGLPGKRGDVSLYADWRTSGYVKAGAPVVGGDDD
jgi:twinkle protein